MDKDEDPESRAIEDMNDRHYEPRNDTILQKVADFLVPLMIIFGIYVVLNGHISPGGGFSGGGKETLDIGKMAKEARIIK